MSSGPADGGRPLAKPFAVEFHLFDSLVHHLIEKGLLTKTDALSVVQTAAEVMRGHKHQGAEGSGADEALAMLERAYSSFEALPERYHRPHFDDANVLPMRIPLHGDQPSFPSDEDD